MLLFKLLYIFFIIVIFSKLHECFLGVFFFGTLRYMKAVKSLPLSLSSQQHFQSKKNIKKNKIATSLDCDILS